MRGRVGGTTLALGLALAAGAAAPARAGATERVSVGPGGAQADGPSREAALSPGGRYVAFSSEAPNLVPDDTNGAQDVFLHDRRTGRTRRVSVGPRGAQADGPSDDPSVSAGGRFVAFTSDAANLVRGDTNGQPDVFVHDLRTGTTSRVSVDRRGRQARGFSARPALSADGRFVAFSSTAADLVPGDTNGEFDVFVRGLRTGAVERASVGPGGVQARGGFSVFAALSADGRVVAFNSTATNLVPGDTNGTDDVFVRTR